MTHPAAGAERHRLDPNVRAQPGALERVLHADFLEIGRSGRVFNRDQMIAALAAEPAMAGEPQDMEVDELAYGNALVTYQLEGVRRSSIWVREAGRWQIRFHQATPIAMSENR